MSGNGSAEGVVSRIIFRNEENGYTVFALEERGEDERICIGNLPALKEGECIAVEGTVLEHPIYGEQLKVERFEYREIEEADVMERYLASGAVKGVGAALASRIVKRFGEDTLRILREEPERLAEVKGISDRKAQEIGVQVAEQEEMRSALVFLSEYGLSLSLSVKVFRFYGREVYSVIRDNPYQLAEDIDGVGFKTADEIARRGGFAEDSEYRLQAGLLYVLYLATVSGHLYLPEEVLIRNAEEILMPERELLIHALDTLIMERRVIAKRAAEGVRVYLSSYYYLELNCAQMLKELNRPVPIKEEEVEAHLARIGKSGDIELDPEQRRAVSYAARNGVLLLTGGPGTGKTTTINAMIRYFETSGMRFVLAAPTGRAARRMTEATGYEASTIHKLLEVNAATGDRDDRTVFGRNEEHPLEVDVVIIDEVSMVDIFLLHALLRALPGGTHLILSGDADQLPSVGPGDVLRDILLAGCFPTVTLTKIFRQANGSEIVMNAHRINKGEQILLENRRGGDFFYLSGNEAPSIIRRLIRLIRSEIPKNIGVDPFDVQVLTPMRKGVLGVEELNRTLQEAINPPSSKKDEVSQGSRIFRTGDKVMQIRNNYQIEWEIRGISGIAVERGNSIFNGDMGVIKEVRHFSSELLIEFDGGRFVEYPFPMLEELEHAYAVTVHKSQGSEYPVVLLPVLSGPPILMTRNLLYTAVTRARQLVVLLGREEAIRGMIRNRSERDRYTSLREHLQEGS